MVAPGEDPYRDSDGASGSEDSDEAMDLLAREDDRVLLTVRNEEELHSLNVWVYEQEGAAGGGGGNVFVSREVPLAAFPLAVEWLDFALDGGPVGHLCAVSTTSPEIEIFDLDFHEALAPDLTLGGEGAADGQGRPLGRSGDGARTVAAAVQPSGGGMPAAAARSSPRRACTVTCAGPWPCILPTWSSGMLAAARKATSISRLFATPAQTAAAHMTMGLDTMS